MKAIQLATLLIVLILSFGVADARTEKYCKDYSETFKEHRDSEDVEYDLTQEAEKANAVEIFSNELSTFPFKNNKDEIENSLRDFIVYDDDKKNIRTVNNNALNLCMDLVDLSIRDESDRDRFKKVKVGEICNYDPGLLSDEKAKLIGAFATDIKAGKGLPDITSMLNEPANLQSKSLKQLKAVVRLNSSLKKGSQSLQCISLYVYPIELYAASSPIKLTPDITFLPTVKYETKYHGEAGFKIIIINQDYTWKFKSPGALKSTGVMQKDEIDVTEKFFDVFKNPEFHEYLKINVRDLISVGMASCEGELKAENRRARKRALQLKNTINSILAGKVELNHYALNLGRLKKGCGKDDTTKTKFQRRSLLVGVTLDTDRRIKMTEEVGEDALRKTMGFIYKAQPETLEINPEDYNLFDIIK